MILWCYILQTAFLSVFLNLVGLGLGGLERGGGVRVSREVGVD